MDAAVIPFNSPQQDVNKEGRTLMGPHPLMCINGSSRCSALPHQKPQGGKFRGGRRGAS